MSLQGTFGPSSLVCRDYKLSVETLNSVPGGSNYHINWYGTCHFFWAPFSEQKINLGVSFLVNSQVFIDFWVSF